MNKEDVCVFIDNEAHLQQARELLERYGDSISSNFQDVKREIGDFLILKYSGFDKVWYLSTIMIGNRQAITLSELEEILKQ